MIRILVIDRSWITKIEQVAVDLHADARQADNPAPENPAPVLENPEEPGGNSTLEAQINLEV